MKIKREDGFTGTDISISVIVLFIFVSLIATLAYQFNSSAKELEIRREAIDIAIEKIESIKNTGFIGYEGMYNTTIEEKTVEGKQGYYETIKIIDYTEIEGNENKKPDLVKKVTVIISYNFKNQEQNVELSTILAKEI